MKGADLGYRFLAFLSVFFCLGVHYGLPIQGMYLSEGLALLFALLVTTHSFACNRHDKYLMSFVLASIVLVLYSSAVTLVFFNQPFYLGLAANRSVLWVVPLAVLCLRMDYRAFEMTLFFICGMWVFLTGLIALFVEPGVFVSYAGLSEDDAVQLVDYSASFDRERYKFSWIPVAFLVALGLERLRYGTKLSAYLAVLVAVGWLLATSASRTTIVQFAIFPLVYALLTGKGAWSKFFKALVLVAFGGGSYLLVAPGAIDSFLDAVLAIFGESQSGDPSVLARIDQMRIASLFFDRVSGWGTGIISSATGGFSEYYGRFHPSDLGIYGAFVAFGVLGVLFYVFQIYILRRSLKERVSVPAWGGLCFVFLLGTVTSGISVFRAQIFFLAFLMMHMAQRRLLVSSGSSRSSGGSRYE